MKKVSLSSSGDLFESMMYMFRKSSKSSHLRRFNHALTFAIILKENDS